MNDSALLRAEARYLNPDAKRPVITLEDSQVINLLKAKNEMIQKERAQLLEEFAKVEYKLQINQWGLERNRETLADMGVPMDEL